jgi:hypothetical protein
MMKYLAQGDPKELRALSRFLLEQFYVPYSGKLEIVDDRRYGGDCWTEFELDDYADQFRDTVLRHFPRITFIGESGAPVM